MAGNVKLILSLVWMLIQKYHIQTMDAKRAMLDWVQVTSYHGCTKCNIIKVKTYLNTFSNP